jgi:hypothetical protein
MSFLEYYFKKKNSYKGKTFKEPEFFIDLNQIVETFIA